MMNIICRHKMADNSSMKDHHEQGNKVINNYYHSTRSSDDAECSGTQNKRVKYEDENNGDSSPITHGQCTDNTPSEVEPSTSFAEQEFSNSRNSTRVLLQQISQIHCTTTLGAEISSNSNFTILPMELLIEIFGYVTSRDLWNFCDAYKDFGYLLQEKALTRNINLQSWYNDVNINTLFNTLNPEYITCINLNGCHWLPYEDLLNFISKCVNLETLSALGTQLELTDQDIKTYKETKIRTIAVSKKSKTLSTMSVLDSVTHLTLEITHCHCPISHRSSPPEDLNRVFPCLQTIWVEDDTDDFLWILRWFNAYKSSNQLHEIIFSGRRDYFTMSRLSEISSATNLHLYYVRKSNATKSMACFVNSKPDNDAVPLPIEWQTLEDLHLQKPYGRTDAKLLHLGARTLDTIQFEELNLDQPHRHELHCNLALFHILMLPNARNIKRLSLCICVLEDFKKIRLQVASNPVNRECVLNIFKELRMLRLFQSPVLPPPMDLREYNSIANLTKLRHLDVEIPVNCDGQFVLEVLKKCVLLETLRIKNYKSDLFNRCAYNPFKYSANLKELMLQRSYGVLRIDDLLRLLINSKHMKLQKLYVSCWKTNYAKYDDDDLLTKYSSSAHRLKHFSIFSLDLLSEFMRSNPQLTHYDFYIAMLNAPQKEFIKEQVKAFKMPHVCFNIDCDFTDFESIPYYQRHLLRLL